MPQSSGSPQPLVLVPTQATVRAESEGGARPVQALNRAYVAALQAVGLTPVLLPTRSSIPADLSFVSGLLLPGGPDVDPLRYGQDLDPSTEPDTESDQIEFALAEWALGTGIPLFAICRGLQVLNVALGGTLHQDLPDHIPRRDPEQPSIRDELAHTLRLEPASRLREIVGADEIRVNSLHHQGIDRLASGLVANAWAPDGLIEGVEMPGRRFVIGVQYHPEELAANDPAARALFEGFAAAAQELSSGQAKAESDRMLAASASS
ncbi:MAG: gamma-glutamyl-gamma-aminobutyrate hydrolase family protein [Candidatus Dormiibacterota bacterium]